MARLVPPALDLHNVSATHWTSLTKVIRQPERYWPAELLTQPIITRRIGRRTLALIADPEAAKTILTGSEEEFPRPRLYQVGGLSGRDSLIASSGRQWRRQRRSFSAMFRPETVSKLLPLYRRAIALAIADWGGRPEPIRLDMSLEMMRLAMGIIWQALFGQCTDDALPPFVDDVAARIHAAQLRSEDNVVARHVAELADAAQRRGPHRGILQENPFNAWGAASGDPAQHGLTRKDFYDNARLFLGAGHETVALTLSWAFWLVARDAQIQRRLHDEIDQVIDAGPIEAAHIERLSFTGNVLNETLRLFAPGFVTVRRSRDPIVLAGERLPASTVLAVCIYALHRHRQWWDEPDLFHPDRFGAGEPRHRYAFLPFSVGPRACIGATFAWTEAVTIFASILQRFSVATDTTVPIKLRTGISLRPDHALPIVLHPRR